MLTRSEIIDERNSAVVISNKLIQNSYFRLTKIQLKSLLYTISKIQETDEPWKEYRLSVRNMCEVCNMPTTGTNAYKGRGGAVYEAMRELRGKNLDLFDERGNLFNTGWFSSVKMEADNDTISVYFDINLMPYLFHLKRELGYTITHLDNLLAMDSPAGMRLYLFLRSIAYNGTHQRISLDEIRERTGNAGKYEKYKDLRVRVLTPAINDINTYSDIYVEYNEVPQGRRIVALDFTIRSKNMLTEDERMLRRRNRVISLNKGKHHKTYKRAATLTYTNKYRKA